MPPMAGPQSRCDLNTTHMAWETHSRAIGMTGGVFSPAPHGEDAPRQDGRRGAAAERDAHVSPGALPPEGVHPDAGTQSAGLPVPPGATSEQVALGKRIFHGEVAGATCAGCHGADGIGTPVGADLASGTWLWGDGSLKSITRASPISSEAECRSPNSILAQCLRSAVFNCRRVISPLLRPMFGRLAIGQRDRDYALARGQRR
jgi:mono/diheme cytochrome c family protein